jgi:hypothetical protein
MLTDSCSPKEPTALLVVVLYSGLHKKYSSAQLLFRLVLYLLT